MFENLRNSLNDLLARATKPEERRDVLARMKDSLITAKLGVEDLRKGVEATRTRLDGERRELETARRRKGLAEGIQDAETVALATKYENYYEERVKVLEEKLAAQEHEADLADRELEEMRAELKRQVLGAVPPASTANIARDPLADEPDARAQAELDAMARERARTDAADDAERRLEDLKRRMGKAP